MDVSSCGTSVGRTERHPGVDIAIGRIPRFEMPAKTEIAVPWIADRPATHGSLKIQESDPQRRRLGQVLNKRRHNGARRPVACTARMPASPSQVAHDALPPERATGRHYAIKKPAHAEPEPASNTIADPTPSGAWSLQKRGDAGVSPAAVSELTRVIAGIVIALTEPAYA